MPANARANSLTPSVSTPEPIGLSHQIVISLPYQNIDGPNVGKTDARYATLGKATWDPTDISLKVWRFANERWSRQSEELPPHRPIDLVILLVLAIEQIENGEIIVPRNTFHEQSQELRLPVKGTELELYMVRGRLASTLLNSRLKALHTTLDRLFGSQQPPRGGLQPLSAAERQEIKQEVRDEVLTWIERRVSRIEEKLGIAEKEPGASRRP